VTYNIKHTLLSTKRGRCSSVSIHDTNRLISSKTEVLSNAANHTDYSISGQSPAKSVHRGCYAACRLHVTEAQAAQGRAGYRLRLPLPALKLPEITGDLTNNESDGRMR